jgi:hypothetical protein
MARKHRRRGQRRPNESGPQAAGSASNDASAPRIGSPGPGRRPGARPEPAGARVARVAVDDATWAAFRELCGRTPASVRLGELVEADVRRAMGSTPESEAVEAVRAIREHADRLEAYVRATAG